MRREVRWGGGTRGDWGVYIVGGGEGVQVGCCM